MQKSGHFDIF